MDFRTQALQQAGVTSQPFTRHAESIPCRRYHEPINGHLRDADYCSNCTRPLATGDDPEEIDPLGARISPTVREGAMCRERIPLLSDMQKDAMSETAGLHCGRTVPAIDAVQHPAELGASSGTPIHTEETE